MPADDPRLAVASERAGGSPFALALYADLLHTRPDLPVDELRTYPSADLAYLIERVLERIPDPYVHWLLRYGVVPRRLTWTYVKDVMAKRLKEATSGVETYDKSNNDPLPEHKKQTLFRRDLLRPVEPLKALDEIWKNLTQYASQSSWVSRVDNDPNILLFHPEVLNPMRWLLREHQRDAFRLLHADAVRYFKLPADLGEREWTRRVLEAVFHRFQRGDAKARDFWRRQLNYGLDRDWLESRRDLARDVLGSDYKGTVDDALRAEVHFELRGPRPNRLHRPAATSKGSCGSPPRMT